MKLFNITAIVLLAAFSSAFSANVHALEAQRTDDGKLLLANRRLRATIDPAAGGALISLAADGGRELLAGPSFVDKNILVNRRIEDLAGKAFEVSEGGVAGETAEWAVSLRLPPDRVMDGENLVGRAWDAIVWHPEASLADHRYQDIVLTKRYRLSMDSPMLRVDYELKNTGDESVAISLGSDVALAGSSLCVPTRDGPLALHLPLSAEDRREILALSGHAATTFYDAPEAWAAMLTERGAGALAVFDPRHASFINIDTARKTAGVGRTRVEVGAGETFRTGAWIMPVAGLDRIDCAANGIAAAFSVSPEDADGITPARRLTYTAAMLEEVVSPLDHPRDGDLTDLLQYLRDTDARGKDVEYIGDPIEISLSLVSAQNRRVEAVFSARANNSPEARRFKTKHLELKAERPARATVSISPERTGTFIITADIIENGREIARFERPVKAGGPRGFYIAEPAEKEGDVVEDFRVFPRHHQPMRYDWQPAMEALSPHVAFANPLAGGPLNTLFALPYARSREVVELAQRIEMQYECVIYDVAGFSQDARRLAHRSEVERLRALLNTPRDLIILPTFMGQRYPLDVMEEIIRQVEEDGSGLIVTLAKHLEGPLAEWSAKAQPDRARFGQGRARVLQVGGGRVAFFDGDDSRGNTLMVSQSHDATEYDYDHFLRVMLWAANREPAVTPQFGPLPEVARRDALDALPAISVRNTGETAFSGALRLTARKDLAAEYPYYALCVSSRRLYPSWEDWATIERPVRVEAGGAQDVRMALPALASGPYALDAQVVDAEGRVVSWSRNSLTVESRGGVREVFAEAADRSARVVFGASEADERLLAVRERQERYFTADQDDVLRVTVKADSPAPARIRLVAFDPWGRTLFDEAQPLGEGAVVFEAPLHAAQHRVLELKARLEDDAGCAQERRLMGFIRPRNDRLPAFGWNTYSPDSDIRPDITGYDSRYRGFVGERDIVMHAWANMGMTGLPGGLPSAEDIILPGAQPEAPPEFPPLPGMDGVGEAEIKDLFGEEEPATEGWTRQSCLTDPEFRKNILSHIDDYFRTRSRFVRPFNVSMGDEWYYTKEIVDTTVPAGFRRQFILSRDANICRSETCLASFHEYCKKAYDGDLDALNASWATDFKHWEDVDPLILGESVIRVPKSWKHVDVSRNKVVEERCPPEEAWPRVIAHRRSIDHMVAGLIADMRETARRAAPESKLGWGDLMGDTSMWNGLDAYLLAAHMDYNALNHEEIIWRTLGNRENSHWVGYAKQYSRIRESTVPWFFLFRGSTSIGTWNSSEYPKHREDYTFYEGPEVIFKTMRKIRENGFDRLLVGNRAKDPIAIHYDPTSIYLSEMQEWREDQERFFRNMAIASRSHTDTCRKVWLSYANMLSQRSLQHYATAYGQLEEGGFGRFGAPKLLFLPYTQAISDRQAETLERFVREGGTLVGDIHTGFRDGFGKRRAEGVLNEVFGIRQTRTDGMRVRTERARVAGKDGGETIEERPIPVHFGAESGGPFALAFEAVGPGDIESTTARALASFTVNGEAQPAFLVNEYGRGKAIYLNFLPCGIREVERDIAEDRVEGSARDFLQAIFAAILREAKISDPVTFEGSPSVTRFADGDVEYLGVDLGYKFVTRWREEHALILPEKRHVYDMIDARYLGFVDRIPVKPDIARPIPKLNQLYALLPYRVTGVDVSLEATEVAQGGSLRFEARIEPVDAREARHVLSARVITPDGRDLPWYRTCIETRDGAARGRIDLALNDPPGEWTLRLKDAASGVQRDARFVVK